MNLNELTPNDYCYPTGYVLCSYFGQEDSITIEGFTFHCGYTLIDMVKDTKERNDFIKFYTVWSKNPAILPKSIHITRQLVPYHLYC